MLDWLPHVPMFVEGVIVASAFVAALYALRKTVYQPLKATYTKWNAGMDTLVGYDAVHDPGSGKQLKAATPPLALRVDDLESAMHKLIDNQETLINLSQRVVSLEKVVQEHMDWSKEWKARVEADTQAWQKEHEALHLLSHQTAEEINKHT